MVTDARSSLRVYKNNKNRDCFSKTEQSRPSRNVNAVESRIVKIYLWTWTLLFPHTLPFPLFRWSIHIHLSRVDRFWQAWSSTDNKFLCSRYRSLSVTVDWTPERLPFEWWPCAYLFSCAKIQTQPAAIKFKFWWQRRLYCRHLLSRRSNT